jgi:glutamate 5-kinase
VVVANGNTANIITRIVLQNEALGTRFTAVDTHLENRKRYLLSGLKDAAGIIQIDGGAVRALKQGGSLLPVGIKSTQGNFVRGDSVVIVDSKQRQIGVGLVNYDSSDVMKISGKQSDQIPKILGFAFGADVVHRDNLVVFSVEKDQG